VEILNHQDENKRRIQVTNYIYCVSDMEGKWTCCRKENIPWEMAEKAKESVT
jgi:hypothetical protein